MQERLSVLTPEDITPEVVAELRSLATDLVQSCVDASASISNHLANANSFKPCERRSLLSHASAARELIARFQRVSGAHDPLVHLSHLAATAKLSEFPKQALRAAIVSSGLPGDLAAAIDPTLSAVRQEGCNDGTRRH